MIELPIEVQRVTTGAATNLIIATRWVVIKRLWIVAAWASAEFAGVVVDVGGGFEVAGQVHGAAVDDTGAVITACRSVIVVGEGVGTS